MGSDKAQNWLDRLRDRLHSLLDTRRESRRSAERSELAILSLRGRDHQVGVLDLSKSGAMIAFDGHAHEGDPVTIQLLDHGLVAGQLRWIRDGRAGIFFIRPLDGEVKGV
jgi:hypothetical protein